MRFSVLTLLSLTSLAGLLLWVLLPPPLEHGVYSEQERETLYGRNYLWLVTASDSLSDLKKSAQQTSFHSVRITTLDSNYYTVVPQNLVSRLLDKLDHFEPSDSSRLTAKEHVLVPASNFQIEFLAKEQVHMSIPLSIGISHQTGLSILSYGDLFTKDHEAQAVLSEIIEFGEEAFRNNPYKKGEETGTGRTGPVSDSK